MAWKSDLASNCQCPPPHIFFPRSGRFISSLKYFSFFVLKYTTSFFHLPFFGRATLLIPLSFDFRANRSERENPILECSKLDVTNSICWEIICLLTGETQQAELEKFSHSHCLIHDEDKSACRHELKQLAVWFNGNNLEVHEAKKNPKEICKSVGGIHRT